MKLIATTLIAAVFSVAGCAGSASRYSLPDDQQNYRVVIAHAEGKAKAFTGTELALAESFNDLSKVLQLKQADAGIFLLKPVVFSQVGGPLGPQVAFHYTLKIKVTDDQETLDFAIGTDDKWASYPPSNNIPSIQEKFSAIARSIASEINGTLKP